LRAKHFIILFIQYYYPIHCMYPSIKQTP